MIINKMTARDPDLSVLLDFDGLSFAVDGTGNYTVSFIVRQVPRTAERPHGLSYSLTLHDETGARLVGFDNAHAAPARKGRPSRAERDHRHRLLTVQPYKYRDAATLLADFWADVDSVLKERGVLP
jgi:Family of unknown function (DUF6516)